MKKTKKDYVLEYMKTHKKGITSMEAFERCGETRLSGTIYSLKKEGYQIVSEPKKVKTRYGRDTLVSAYRLLSNEIPSKAKTAR